MIQFTTRALLGVLVCLCCCVSADALDHDAAFQQLVDYMEGRWTPAKLEDSEPRSWHVYSRALSGKFMRTDGTRDALAPWDGMLGIEPQSGKLTWWGFWANGDGGVIYLTDADENQWTFKGEGRGANGRSHRTVIIRKMGESRTHGIVKDRIDGQTVTLRDRTWVRYRSGDQKPPAKCDKMPWEFLRGHWEFSNSKGIKASVQFRDAAGGKANIGEWISSEGREAVELLRWDAAQRTLVAQGHGERGNSWHVEYISVSKDRCSGPAKVVYPDGSQIVGVMTLRRVGADLATIKTIGIDQDGQPTTVTAQLKRVP